MITTEMKAKRGKCLALFAIMAMVICAFAIVSPGADAADTGAVASGIEDLNGFTDALTSSADGEYKVAADINGTISAGLTVTNKITIDLNGKTIALAGGQTIVVSGELKLKNGTISINGFSDGTKAAIQVKESASVYVDSVEMATDGSALYPDGNAAKVSVTNQSIIRANAYCIGTNAGHETDKALEIIVEKSELIASGDLNKDDATVMINVKNANLRITDSTLTGDRQALIVRSGTAVVTGTTINYTDGFTGSAKNSYDNALWKTGNEVPAAAIVVGDNSSAAGYAGKASLTLTGGTINASSGNVIITSAIGVDKTVELNIGKTDATTIAIGSDSAEIKNLTITAGGFVVKKGSVDITGDFELDANGSITVTGNAIITGDVSLDSGASINVLTGATLTIANGKSVTLNGSSKITGNGTVIVDSDAKIEALAGSTVDVANITNNGNILSTPDATVKSAISGTGTVSIGGTSWSTITLTGGTIIDASTSIVGSASQEIRITGDVTVTSGGAITVNGKLVIEKDATLTLKSGAQLIVNGVATAQIDGEVIAEAGTSVAKTFQFNGSEMNVTGSVTLNGADSFESTGTVNISGFFEIAEDASAVLNKTVVAEGGVLTIYGIATGTMTNNGTITVDSQGSSASEVNLNVTMGDKAVIDAVNLTGKIVVTGGATIEDVAGATVTATVKTENRVTTTTYHIAGDVTAADNYDGSNTAGTITVTGNDVEIDGTLTLGTGIKMTVNGALSVIGEVTAVADTTATQIDGTGAITITGTITSVKEITVTVINAAMYKTLSPANAIYTTLISALGSGATSIDLLGNNSVDSDVDIPVGTTVKMNAGSKLTIADDATMTIDASDRKSGKLTTVDNGVDVKGTLVVMDKPKSGVTETHVNSDTKKVSGDSITFTNIYNAINGAADGETVEITRNGELTLKKDLEVPAGVVLKVPTGKILKVDNGVTVKINGKVVVEGTYTIADKTAEKAAGSTVVNGLFQYTGAVDVYNAKIVGAYFTYDGKMTIAPLASVVGMASDIRSDVELYGDMKLDSIDFSVYDGEGTFKIVKIMNKLTFDSFTIGKIKFEMGTAGVVNGKVVAANGSLALVNVTGIAVQDITSSDSTVSTVTGTIASPDSVTSKSIAIDGAFTFSVTSVAVPVTINAGSTVTVKSGDFTGDVQIDGTVKVASTGITFGTVTILGTVESVENNKATATKMYIGLTAKDLGLTTGSAAVVDGMGLATGVSAVAYVSPSAEVKGFDSAKKTEYYYNDALYLTAYANDGNDVAISAIKITVPDAKFKGWLNSEKQPIDSSTVTAKVGSPEKVYASVKYDIFNIKVTVDNGIGSVAINGMVLENQSGNVYLITGLKAGTCKVTYVLKPNYEGTPILTVNGKEQTSLEFTLTGTPAANEDAVNYTLSLVGTSPVSTIVPSSDDKDDGMGLTDILLIVLVVLIAIMAIMVALRMMRS